MIYVKHLFRSLFFNKAAGCYARAPFSWNIYKRLLLADSLLKSYLESFWKISQKTPLKKSCFNNIADCRPETLQIHNLAKLPHDSISSLFWTTSNIYHTASFTISMLNARRLDKTVLFHNFFGNFWVRYTK